MDKFEQWFKTYRPSLVTSAIEAEFIFEAGQQSRQTELDQLNEVLDERTKEWLEAIKLGTYFQEAAKPLKDKVDQLQSQINEMAEVGLSQESVIREKDKRIEEALFQMRQQALSLKEDCDGYKDPVGICQSEGIDWCVRFLEKILRGEHD